MAVDVRGDVSDIQKAVSMVGCGWLGFPLATSLIDQGYKVKGSTTSTDKLTQLESVGIESYLLKISDELEGGFQGLFAADILVINIPPGRRDKDVVNTYPRKVKLILAEWGRARAGAASHVIFVSSTGVYQSTGDVVDETTICNPERDSGKAVFNAESIIRDAAVPYTILRMAGLVGGERQPGRWFEGKVDIPGGDTPVNMIHQEDCIHAITSVISKSATNDIYNLCADEHPVKREFYQEQAKKLSIVPPLFLNGMVPHKIVDNSKFKKCFNFVYRHQNPKSF